MMQTFFRQIVFLAVLTLLIPAMATAQTVVDKMLVSVSDGIRTELITRSDVMWQLALQPGATLDQPRESDLNEALQRLTEQRLIALEAERLPAAAPTEADVTNEIRRFVTAFGSAATFEARLRRVGFASIDDPNFRRIIEQRLAIEKYLSFRFRSFVVITPADEERFYNERFVPNFRRTNPGVVVPSLDAVRNRISEELTEQRVAAEIERFLEEARGRAVITTLNPL